MDGFINAILDNSVLQAATANDDVK